jgi:hypothetical protein
MISRNLWQRLKRLEDKIKPRCEPKMTRKELQLVRRLEDAKRRIALEDGKPYVEYGGPGAIVDYPPGPNRIVMILHAARKRVQENDRLEEGAATDGSEHNT